jgi:hypothetical protein
MASRLFATGTCGNATPVFWACRAMGAGALWGKGLAGVGGVLRRVAPEQVEPVRGKKNAGRWGWPGVVSQCSKALAGGRRLKKLWSPVQRWALDDSKSGASVRPRPFRETRHAHRLRVGDVRAGAAPSSYAGANIYVREAVRRHRHAQSATANSTTVSTAPSIGNGPVHLSMFADRE